MRYSDRYRLHINEKCQITDAVYLVLTYFSHKHPTEDGPTKATAHVTISDGKDTEDILLSVFSKYRETEIEYDAPVVWKNLKFEMIGFDYDSFIELIVSKI